MTHTRAEILSQPATLRETLTVVDRDWQIVDDLLGAAPVTQWMFLGSGTSLYIATAAAHAFQEVTGNPARAIPSSDAFLSPASSLPTASGAVAVVISRSGTTSEALMAIEYLRQQRPETRIIGITCVAGSALTEAVDACLVLSHAAEQSMVMTRSFTSMLLALQQVAARYAEDQRLAGELDQTPELTARLLDEAAAFGASVGGRTDLQRFAFLGLGPSMGLALEATLKLEEMTQVPCAAYGILEFRHGPISVVDERVGVVLLAGERERSFVRGIEADVRRHAGFLATIAPYATEHASVSLTLPDGLSDIARSVLYLPAVQFLAHERAIASGLNPDAPRHLNPVVVLDAPRS